MNRLSASSLDSWGAGPAGLPAGDTLVDGAGGDVVDGGGAGGDVVGGDGAGDEAVTRLTAAAWRFEDGVPITLTLGINLEVNLFFLLAEIVNIPRPEVFDEAESADSSLSSCLVALIGVARSLFFRSSPLSNSSAL